MLFEIPNTSSVASFPGYCHLQFLHVSDKKVDSDKGLGPGYWNCLHGFNVCVPVWGEPGKEANIAGCKKCKQEIKKCTHWFCMFKLNTCSQMTASPIEMNSS